MSNVLITMLTLGKQEWIVIPDGVENGQEVMRRRESFFLTLSLRVKKCFSLSWLLGSLRSATDVCSSQTPWLGLGSDVPCTSFVWE